MPTSCHPVSIVHMYAKEINILAKSIYTWQTHSNVLQILYYSTHDQQVQHESIERSQRSWRVTLTIYCLMLYICSRQTNWLVHSGCTKTLNSAGQIWRRAADLPSLVTDVALVKTWYEVQNTIIIVPLVGFSCPVFICQIKDFVTSDGKKKGAKNRPD